MITVRHLRNKRLLRWAIFLVCSLGFWAFLPDPLFQTPYSTVIQDESGRLLSARIARDGQWRFPEQEAIPEKLQQAIIHYEDEWYFWHPGVNPVSLFRALSQNLRSGRVVSGGSTVTMQVIRLSQNNPPRTITQKLLELLLAIRLEFSFSKQEIMAHYTAHAPYGGNVVGAEAAAWRYFARPLEQLSWAECATLAVLPNAPALIHPGRNRKQLEAKRNRLLNKLWRSSVIDSTTCALAQLERIPPQPKNLPNQAPHLLDLAIQQNREGSRLITTLQSDLQQRLQQRLDKHVELLSQNEVDNACALIVSLRDNRVLAYIGNATIPETRARFVDLIRAPRSSGSILKPFLFAAATETGVIHPRTLLRDIPVTLGNFSPSNFDKQFDGAVPAGEALARSLNVPATLLLRDYGQAPFHADLQELGLTTITRSVDDYGLSLILGGAEVKLWDLARSYTQQAVHLKAQLGDSVVQSDLQIWRDHVPEAQMRHFDPGAWWLTTEALTQVKRPGLHSHWQKFSSSRKVAWKTGTSQGFRDAWAVGYDREYLVAVWVGNADGEGRPGLTGVSTAAPLMFEAFQLLPAAPWFDPPFEFLRPTPICSNSGLAPGPSCPRDSVLRPFTAKIFNPCTFHQEILLDENGNRAFRDCASGPFQDTSWFELDPVTAYFYRKKHPNYRPIPPLAASCATKPIQSLAIIYPTSGTEIIVPKDFNRQFEQIRFEAAHQDPKAQLFWHLNEEYLGTTTGRHILQAEVPAGKHRLTVVDQFGNSVSSRFQAFRS